MLHETSVASTRSSAVEPVDGWWPSRTRKPSTSSPVFSAARLLLVGRRGRDRPGAEAGHGGHDLEHRAGHVPPQRRARQERLGRVGLERLERRLGGVRVRDRGRVVGRGRGERQHLAGRRVEHDHRAASLAERRHGRPLQVVGQRQGQVLGVVSVGAELGERVAQVVAGEAAELGVVGALEARPPVGRGRVADDLADGPSGVDPDPLAVRVRLVVGQDRAGPIEDLARGARSGRRR